MQSNRIIAPLITSALDYGWWLGTGSGHFAQLRTHVLHELEFHSLPACFETSYVSCFAM